MAIGVVRANYVSWKFSLHKFYLMKDWKAALEGILKTMEKNDNKDMKKIIVLGMCIFLLWSCNINPDKSATHQEQAHSLHQNDINAEKIALNNGEKWVVNEEMKPFVLKGSELVNGYIRNNKGDYKSLASQLKDQNNQLIKSCTMKGKSHEELHKWLHPHLELVKELENSSDEKGTKEIVLKLQKSNEEYHRYFN